MKLFQLGTAAFVALLISGQVSWPGQKDFAGSARLRPVKVAAIQAQPLHVPAALSVALFGETLERADASRCEAQVKEDAVLGAVPLWAFVGALSQDSLGLISAFNFVRVRRPEQKENASQRSFGNVVLMTSAMMVISHPAAGNFS